MGTSIFRWAGSTSATALLGACFVLSRQLATACGATLVAPSEQHQPDEVATDTPCRMEALPGMFGKTLNSETCATSGYEWRQAAGTDPAINA